MRCPHCDEPVTLARDERWEAYEAAKRAWVRAHPEATDAEYRRAIDEIKREVGV